LVGANEFPDLGEAAVQVLNVPRAESRTRSSVIAPIPQMRLAEPYEALRDASDRALARTGERPAIFLANLGASADFSERATYAQNFFAAGGIEAIMNDGFGKRDSLVEAFKASGTQRAC